MSDGFKVSERPHGQVPVLSQRPGMVDVVDFDDPPRKQLEGPDVRSVFVTPTNAELAAWRTVAAAVHVLDRAGVPDDAVRLMGGVMVALHIRLSGLDLGVRATRDADLGMPLHLVTEHRVEEALTTRSESVCRRTVGLAAPKMTSCSTC